ncbi:MAG: alkaline phosphatase family protein [Promethearchaeota archaeon]
MNKVNRVIFCIIDDVRAEFFFNLMRKGFLPNMKKLMKQGIYSENCITDFPPITYPTQVSLLTGTYTGNYKQELCHGIPLMNWMDRDYSPPILRSYAAIDMQIYKLNSEIENNCKTILEMIDEGNTVSITQFISRGSNYFFPERKTTLALYYLILKYFPSVKRRLIRANSGVVQKLIGVFEKPKRFFENSEPPICSLIWFISSDLLMHAYGYDSKIYKLNILHIDKVIGILMDTLEKMGYLDDTAIVITSDHGNYKANKVGNLTDFFTQNKLTHYHPRKNLKGNMNISEYAGVGFFNFKGLTDPEDIYKWARPSLKELENYGPRRINLLEKLFKIEGSLMMYYRDDENTHKKGVIYLKKKCNQNGKTLSGTIEYQGRGNEYKTCYISDDSDNDIFGYLNDDKARGLMDKRFHSINEWLEATYHLNFPIFPDLIPRHFKNPRSCDIILSNDGTVVFNIHHGKQKNKNLYDHDLGLRKCMVVPLIIGGSLEIPSKLIPFCKITDIVPTLLKLLGKTPHKSVMGESLI